MNKIERLGTILNDPERRKPRKVHERSPSQIMNDRYCKLNLFFLYFDILYYIPI